MDSAVKVSAEAAQAVTAAASILLDDGPGRFLWDMELLARGGTGRTAERRGRAVSAARAANT
ncbi:hypothetical protein JCM4814A_29040 [Streptomyces phaeofaciens JCM 4814]|uniref:Uncharacterized protein n=1 Tax=Streptomyces phaeofaciens TaxID=68254 RepID=A0A918LZK9_9ACTN|nr:hypothetical protein GCM10010226_73570 [Streptomyces phaeofaciens]